MFCQYDIICKCVILGAVHHIRVAGLCAVPLPLHSCILVVSTGSTTAISERLAPPLQSLPHRRCGLSRRQLVCRRSWRKHGRLRQMPNATAQEVRLIKTAACLPSQLAKARTLAPTAQSLPHRRCPIYRSLFSNDCSPAASSASVGSHSYFSRMIATLFMTSPPVASRAA